MRRVFMVVQGIRDLTRGSLPPLAQHPLIDDDSEYKEKENENDNYDE
jgi:hypothetical protein